MSPHGLAPTLDAAAGPTPRSNGQPRTGFASPASSLTPDDLERVARAAMDLVASPPVEPVQAFVREPGSVLGHELVHRHRVLLSRGRAATQGSTRADPVRGEMPTLALATSSDGSATRSVSGQPSGCLRLLNAQAAASTARLRARTRAGRSRGSVEGHLVGGLVEEDGARDDVRKCGCDARLRQWLSIAPAGRSVGDRIAWWIVLLRAPDKIPGVLLCLAAGVALVPIAAGGVVLQGQLQPWPR